MKADLERLKLAGKLNELAERLVGANFDADDDNRCLQSVCEAYREAGSPKNIAGWAREKFQSLFLSLGEPPHWIEATPMWPFCNGKPMVFIGQMSVNHQEVAEEHLVPGSVLYLFGGRTPVDGGWRMQYKVIEQHERLRDVQRHPR